MNPKELQLLQSRLQTIKSEPDGIVRETMIDNLLVDIDTTPPRDSKGLDETISDEAIEAAAKESIENALYSTKRFLTTQCSDLAEGIIDYLKDSNIHFARKQPVDNWIDVSERLPEVTETDQWDKERQVSDRVIVIECGVEKFAKYNYLIGAWLVEGRSGNIQVTHWLKLPNKPLPTPKQ